VFAGSANYEDGQSEGSAVRQYDLARHAVDESLGAQESSTGPLALADIDGGGHWALFVGGRVIPGRYPEPASSRIYRYDGAKFQLDPENTKTLARVGLVSGAVWSDLDGDGYPELILACEWGPVRIFRNDRSHLVAWDAPVTNNQQPATDNQQKVTLNQITGCWNGVSTGDFDGDGQMDIVAANWGRNTKYQRYLDRPAKIFYGDFNRAGKVAVVEAFYDPDLRKVVPWPDLDALSRALPFVLERFPTCRAYSTAGVLEVLGTSQVGELSASTLDSMIFLNRGGRFDAKPLPPEAQFAPAFAVCVGDYDGDGSEDIFLSQNFFDVDAETSRYDAGLGLWLRGDGRGNFQAVPGRESGVKIFGEQRGAALCDYDRDGRVDLVVTQNGAETKLYHNMGGQAGLRVRLRGPAGNPQAVGAQMRLSFGTRQGPMREVHAGSGYWSQDSTVLVFGTPESPTEIRVRWPGGQVTTSAITEKAAEISIDSNGKLEVIRMSER